MSWGVFSWAALLGALSLNIRAADPDAQSHARLSYEYLRQGHLVEAEREIRESIRLAPEDPLYHSALAGILKRSDRKAECATEYAKALDALAEDSLQRRKIAEQLEQLDLEMGAEFARNAQFKDGLVLSADAAQRFHESARVFQMLGYFQSKLRMNVAAVNSYRRALDLDPNSTEASLGLGMAQSSAGMSRQAVVTLQSGIKHFPNDPLHLQALGVVFLENGEPDRARAMFVAALRINNSLAESHLQLGNLALQNGDLQTAGQHLKAALSVAPADKRVHFALSRLYRRTGDPEAAIREMKAFEEADAAAKR
jgi:Tfp pilus assembly protein PilF